MSIGLRVIKTVISVGISIMIARALRLEPAHFAGVVSMLAVQPSVYRSIHHSISHIASALLASVLGFLAAHYLGSHALVFSAAALLVMAIHIQLRRTASLTLAVIVAINTIGTTVPGTSGLGSYSQLWLVLIGMTIGTVVNMVRRPVHREREEVLLSKSESMLRALLYYVQFDLKQGTMTPYKPTMRQQIAEVRGYIEQGKEVAQLIREDRWLGKKSDTEGAVSLFHTYETMVERIRDLVKALQKADLTHHEAKRLTRAIELVAGAQERLAKRGRRSSIRRLLACLRTVPTESHVSALEVARLFPYYQAFEALVDYVKELERAFFATIPSAQNQEKPSRFRRRRLPRITLDRK